jgi:hypothetical protein
MGLKLNGWHRLYVVAAVMWMGCCVFYFYAGYPSDEKLRAHTDRVVDEKRAAFLTAEENKNREVCRGQVLADKRATLTSQELDDAENSLRLQLDPAVPSIRKLQAFKNSMWLNEISSSATLDSIEACIKEKTSKGPLVQSLIDEVRQKIEAFDQELPSYRNLQARYLIEAGLTTLAPLFLIYILGLAVMWIRRGFVSTQAK